MTSDNPMSGIVDLKLTVGQKESCPDYIWHCIQFLMYDMIEGKLGIDRQLLLEVKS